MVKTAYFNSFFFSFLLRWILCQLVYLVQENSLKKYIDKTKNDKLKIIMQKENNRKRLI